LIGGFKQWFNIPYDCFSALGGGWDPLLPMKWWTGLYDPITSKMPYEISSMSQEQEKAWPMYQQHCLEQTITQLRQRLKELQQGD
jgi:hypothetical protein